MIGAADRGALLAVARRSIAGALEGSPIRPEVPESGPLGELRGAFVTLKRKGRLRGCIGRIVADRPLAKVVAEMAVAAAEEDWRFEPLSIDELHEVRIEISALGPFLPVHGPSEIVVGRDGLLIRKGNRSGLLLPQVGSEEGWTAERFLDETCRKAGLAPGEWKEGASIERFEAEVWGEEA
ncbi:MAG: AmmeMemoRadiSam system protein A [Candidatus Latescibacterota bacterium]|nr:MAG: AmmeMemoRadiSam system protein A [Candidatus Latescibacterota bacterium]